ncbi:MAG: DNA repair protein [Clostridiales bacterium]|nr:DNA repair protein [Clostridiales bacterium]
MPFFKKDKSDNSNKDKPKNKKNPLKKLKRQELLELLLEQTKRAEALEEELKKKNEELENKKLVIDESGSIAEAALRLNSVFEAAEKAAEQYLQNIKEKAEGENDE